MSKSVLQPLVVVIALALSLVSYADDGDTPVVGNSAFFVSVLEPMPALLGAHIFQAVSPGLRLGVGLGTNSVGYTNGITYSLGGQYILARGRSISPVFGATISSGDVANERRNFFYITTGVEVARPNGLMLGFGVNWGLTQHEGKNLVLPFLRIGSSY